MSFGEGLQGIDRGAFLERLQVLTPEQILKVDQALASIGPFGEVRLVKVKGRVRFIQRLESQDILQVCWDKG